VCEHHFEKDPDDKFDIERPLINSAQKAPDCYKVEIKQQENNHIPNITN